MDESQHNSCRLPARLDHDLLRYKFNSIVARYWASYLLLIVAILLLLSGTWITHSWPASMSIREVAALIASDLLLLIHSASRSHQKRKLEFLLASFSTFVMLLTFGFYQITQDNFYRFLVILSLAPLTLQALDLYYQHRLDVGANSQKPAPKNVLTPVVVDTRRAQPFETTQAALNYLISLSRNPRAFLGAGADRNTEFHKALRVLLDSLNEEDRTRLWRAARDNNEAFLRALRDYNTRLQRLCSTSNSVQQDQSPTKTITR